MTTEAFFWFLLLAELAAVVFLSVALVEKIRYIFKTYLKGAEASFDYHNP